MNIDSFMPLACQQNISDDDGIDLAKLTVGNPLHRAIAASHQGGFFLVQPCKNRSTPVLLDISLFLDGRLSGLFSVQQLVQLFVKRFV